MGSKFVFYILRQFHGLYDTGLDLRRSSTYSNIAHGTYHRYITSSLVCRVRMHEACRTHYAGARRLCATRRIFIHGTAGALAQTTGYPVMRWRSVGRGVPCRDLSQGGGAFVPKSAS